MSAAPAPPPPPPPPAEQKYVVLLAEPVPDPRDEEERKKDARVVLRLDEANRILVEVEDGRDALDAIAWERLDQPRSDSDAKNLANMRAAYQILCRATSSLFQRARANEAATEREAAKVKQLEFKLFQLRSRPAAPLVAATDPLLREKGLIAQLLALATNDGTTPQERQTAARRVQEILTKTHLLEAQAAPARPPTPPAAPAPAPVPRGPASSF